MKSKGPKHCNAPVLHNPQTNEMRKRIKKVSGGGTGNKTALKVASKLRSPLLLKLSAGCKAAAKKKFKVYPSAYANIWASKTQKKGKC